MAWNSGSSQTRIQFQLNNNISGGANSLAMETTSIDMANGTIYHVVFTYDGSSTPGGCKVWVNGVSQTLATDFNTLSSSIQTTQSSVNRQRDREVAHCPGEARFRNWPSTAQLSRQGRYSYTI